MRGNSTIHVVRLTDGTFSIHCNCHNTEVARENGPMPGEVVFTCKESHATLHVFESQQALDNMLQTARRRWEFEKAQKDSGSAT